MAKNKAAKSKVKTKDEVKVEESFGTPVGGVQIYFPFAPNDKVKKPTLGITGVVTAINVSRDGSLGAWIEYTDKQGQVQDHFARMTELEAA